jgi:hypothetical protein
MGKLTTAHKVSSSEVWDYLEGVEANREEVLAVA